MPTILLWRGHRFFFYSNAGSEPPHVHVKRGDAEAKIWLNELTVAVAIGYSPADMRRLLKKVEEERARFLERWREFFGD